MTINYSPPETKRFTEKDNNYYSFDYTGSKRSQQFNVDWDKYLYHLVTADDYYETRSVIQTDSSNINVGENGYKVRWEYFVRSTSINGGVPTPALTKDFTFNNTLYYKVK
ncbi:hypothetical protein [Neobacillus soli]|uniref:hypothetical protein n=1 Tax=Neobacillus soli TaxID=220688 RepID=UPI000ADF87D6|nr:hypothetical protein [Neobacillus soli]